MTASDQHQPGGIVQRRTVERTCFCDVRTVLQRSNLYNRLESFGEQDGGLQMVAGSHISTLDNNVLIQSINM
jgi:hypothetical protein